jgi:hypothetical protein
MWSPRVQSDRTKFSNLWREILALSRPFVVYTAKVQHTVHNHPQQLAPRINTELLGIGVEPEGAVRPDQILESMAGDTGEYSGSHVHCYEQGASAYPGRGMRSFATGMAGANYYYIKIKCQFILIVYI